MALEGNSPIVPNSDSLGLLTPKADGRRRVHGCPWAVSRWCLNAVSVVSWLRLGGSGLLVLVVPLWCLNGVDGPYIGVFSRERLGVNLLAHADLNTSHLTSSDLMSADLISSDLLSLSLFCRSLSLSFLF